MENISCCIVYRKDGQFYSEKEKKYNYFSFGKILNSISFEKLPQFLWKKAARNGQKEMIDSLSGRSSF